MDVVYRLGRATATDVHAGLADAPTPTTVRGLLRVLEAKGHLRHESEGKRYVYVASTPRADAGRSLLRHVVQTFYAGSPTDAVAALLGSERTPLSKEEVARLSSIVAGARRAKRVSE